MRIDKVILSCTDDSYFDFYKIVSLAWEQIGIETVLFLITDSNKKRDKVINFNVKNIDKVFLSQNIRLLAPALFPDSTCLISDIDMMPMSEDIFKIILKNFQKKNLFCTEIKPQKTRCIHLYNAAKEIYGKNFLS